MKTRLKHLLAPVLLGVLTLSCDQNELEEATPASSALQAEATSNATGANLLFEELFEGTSFLSGVRKETAHSHSLQPSEEVAFEGRKSARFELRDTDNGDILGGTRSEIAFGYATGKDRWYSFAVYFPNDYAPDSHAELITQWHSMPDEHLGENWRSPATKMDIRNDRFDLQVAYNSAKVDRGPAAGKNFDLGPVPKGRWVEFVFHIIHSYSSDGLVEVWMDNKKVVEHRGGNSYNDDHLPFWKIGVYKWAWNGNGTTDTKRRVLYFDNIRTGSDRTSLTDLLSNRTLGSAPTEPAPTAPAPTEPTSPTSPTTTGRITREYWANVSGNAVSSIPLNSRPSSVSELTLFEAPSNVADNYGSRIRGYVTAPATGNYTFWISGDDNAELWLSSSEDPTRKVRLAYISGNNGWTNQRQWDKFSTQKSASVRLEAGKRYYIEALHKERNNTDNLAVGWQLPNGSMERPIPGNRLSPFTI